MTKKYTEKLVRLGKELEELSKPLITTADKKVVDCRWRQAQYDSKLNYLLGYISALEAQV